MSTSWTPEAGRLEAARKDFEAAAAGARSDRATDRGALRLLEAAGRLCILGGADGLPGRAAELEDLDDRISVGLAVAQFDALDGAAAAIGLSAPDIDLTEAAERAVLVAQIDAALGCRHRVELALLGAESLAGRNPELSAEQHELVAYFHDYVRPQLWRLIPIADLRAERTSQICPELRDRFWWWSQGWDVSPQGLDDLSGAAHVVSRFPEANDELTRLIRAQRLLDDGLPPAQIPAAGGFGMRKVVLLHEWLAAKRSALQPPPGELDDVVGMAADDETERLLLVEDRRFTISWIEPDQVSVALLFALAEDRLPELELDGRTLVAEAVSGGSRLFRFKLDRSAQATSRAILHLPFADGPARASLLG